MCLEYGLTTRLHGITSYKIRGLFNVPQCKLFQGATYRMQSKKCLTLLLFQVMWARNVQLAIQPASI